MQFILWGKVLGVSGGQPLSWRINVVVARSSFYKLIKPFTTEECNNLLHCLAAVLRTRRL